jgi:hypothetical protein
MVFFDTYDPEKANWLVVSANKGCAAFKLFNFLRRMNIYNHFKITNILSDKNKHIYERLNNDKNLAVCLHGDPEVSQTFYRSDPGNWDAQVYIENEWWQKLTVGENILYFHVCWGANILRKGGLEKQFMNWLSYDDEIAHVSSGNDTIRQLSETFISRFNNLFQHESNVSSFYKSTKGLYEASIEQLNNNIESSDSIDIHLSLLIQNMNSLACSKNEL